MDEKRRGADPREIRRCGAATRPGARPTGGLVRLLFAAVLALSTLSSAPAALAGADDEEAIVAAALSGSVIAVLDANGNLSPVHYLGVEAPADGQGYHEDARLANSTRVQGKHVLLRRVGPDRLADGARVRHVFVLEGGATDDNPGQPVAASLLAEGQLWRVADPADDLDGWYRQLEAGARATEVGIWALYTPVPVAAYFGTLPLRRPVESAQSPTSNPLAIAPAPVGTPWSGVRADRRLYQPMAALAELGDTWSWVLPALRDNDVQVVLGRLPYRVGGYFAPEPNIVVVDVRFAQSDPKALAAAIVHETTHVRDYYSGEPVKTLEGCFQTEIRAYSNQAEAWLRFYGPEGKHPVVDELDQNLNDLLVVFLKDRTQIERSVRQLYERQCARVASD